MRHQRRAAVLSAAVLLAFPVVAQAATPSSGAPQGAAAASSGARLQPWLQDHLTTVADTTRLRVMVRATTVGAAADAVEAVGMSVQQRWAKVGIAVGVGPASAVRGLLDQPGVLYVEGDTPLDYTLQTAHKATRSDQALTSYPAANGAGVTIAVIDSGIDGTHPFFQAGGKSTVVQNRKNVCGIDLEIDPALSETCFAQAPTNDTDTISGGGHGTHVAGIAAGVPVTTTTPAGASLRGSAPGAKLVGLSVGVAIGLLDAAAAQNWVLEHQRFPCKSAAEQTGTEIDPACPPIRVTNHSYGPIATEGEDQTFNEMSAAVQLQRLLVKEGVVAVWAAGNDGGDGSFAATNPDAMDPTPGIVMVASYDDGQTGNPDNQLSSFSSRGKRDSTGTYPDLSAPGDRITSACRRTLAVCQGSPSFDGGNYQTISGTSMASPYVAGVVAALFSAQPSLTPAQAEDVLEDTAHPFTAGEPYQSDPLNPTTMTSLDKGHGLVDVLAAVAAVNNQTAPAPTAVLPPAPRCGDGTNLVTDPAGDTNAPGGTGAPASAQDLTSLSFAAAASTLSVTAQFVNLSDVPVAGSTSTTSVVTWTGPDGIAYGVDRTTPGGSFRVGQFDATTNRLKTGTTTVVPGTTMAGANGTMTWNVPFAKVGNPVVPATELAGAAVRDSFGLTLAGIGAMGTGLTYTAPVDRAPDGGATAAWSVCPPAPADGGTQPPPPTCVPKGNQTTCKTKGGRA